MNPRSMVVAAPVAAVTALALAVPAGAARLEGGTWSESWSTILPLCGLTVDLDVDEAGSYVVVEGPGGLPRWHENVRAERTFTNPATGRSMTQYVTFHNQDQSVRANDDGTFTLVEKSVGPLRVTGSDGRLLVLDTSAVWWTVVLDADGAVLEETQPFKDVGLQGTDGRDFCADLVAEIG